ncbi:MAG: aminoacyl-tRNA hydrolase [Candidatus Omnitrophica bacterium]|nr:aminoacyl-tRNA hydrolase [Candidatus Omnitrophota bacterium]
MKLIIGLGNPGKEYIDTRHNLGFMVIEELAKKHKVGLRQRRRFKALAGEGVVEGDSCYIAMPQTYMNLSGHSVRSIVKWLNIELKDMLLVMDDIALPLGGIRIRTKGSDAGHKGLRSVIDCLASSEFSRLRVGIMNAEAVGDLSAYVLDRLTKKEAKLLPEILERATSACECWIKEGVGAAMNRYNFKGGRDNE